MGCGYSQDLKDPRSEACHARPAFRRTSRRHSRGVLASPGPRSVARADVTAVDEGAARSITSTTMKPDVDTFTFIHLQSGGTDGRRGLARPEDCTGEPRALRGSQVRAGIRFCLAREHSGRLADRVGTATRSRRDRCSRGETSMNEKCLPFAPDMLCGPGSVDIQPGRYGVTP